jgi:CHASE2 domain-containing sensor protein/tRNA A-37 threonylcarbamoyl transferase component Bud32
MKRFKKGPGSDFVIGMLLTLLMLAALYFEWTPLEVLEKQLYDLELSLQTKSSPSPVVIVAIDDDSIANIGRWPWPRGHIANMIRLLKDYEAQVIGVDIIYSESDISQGLQEVRDLIKKIDEEPRLKRGAGSVYEALKESEQRLDNDTILLTSIQDSSNVVLPLFFVLGKAQAAGAKTEMPDYLKMNSVALADGAKAAMAQQIIPPISDFAKSAAGLGHINVIADADGTIRSEPLLLGYENRYFPSFALQLTLKYLNRDVKDITLSSGLRIANLRIPTYDSNKMLVKFSKDLDYYSFFDVVSNRVSPEAFKKKIVIIALTATGLGTMQVTPIGPQVPACVTIANVVGNILNNEHILRPGWAIYLEIGIILLFGAFISLAIPSLKAGISAIASAALLVLWFGSGMYLLMVNGLWIKILSPSLLLLFGYTIAISKRYLFTEKSKEHIEADSIETNKMLGLSFQGQGLLDMAFDKFRKCPVEDESVKELLYNLGLDFERKRQFNKAVSVYEHIMQDGDFKDIGERAKKLKVAGETMIFGLGAARKDGTVLIDSAETKPTLGRYEIVKELGRGAMGTVYLGKDPKISREVAIKTLRFDEIDEGQLVEIKRRFFREAEAAGKLSHPNIVTIFDVGEDYDIAYMAMELLDGTDLERYVEKENLMPAAEVARIVTAVAQALDYAHRNGVVHRDIKPANIMILNNGDIKVADFGIARVMTSSKTQTGVILGTPSYMSPEQIAGQKVDGRSDLFSLVVVLYEMLSGEKPFQGDSIATLMYNITTSAPIPIMDLAPTLPKRFAAIIEKGLAKDRELRYQTGSELAKELAEITKS